MLKGEGVIPNIKISPEFNVCRLEANTDSYADFNLEVFLFLLFRKKYIIQKFQVTNSTNAPLKICFVKMLDLEGSITTKEKENDDKGKKALKGEKGKGKGKDKGNGKSKNKEKRARGKSSKQKSTKNKKSTKTKKYSENLTEDEIDSLQNNFQIFKGKKYALHNVKLTLVYR